MKPSIIFWTVFLFALLAPHPASAQCMAVPGEVSGPGSPEPLRFTDKTTLAWENGGANCSDSFNLYRGDRASLAIGDFAQCKEAAVPVSGTTDEDIPFTNETWFYFVSGNNAWGEGILGTDTSSNTFNTTTHCATGLEICDDGMDDDLDGLTDCFDPDCFGSSSCSQTVCECFPGPCDPATPQVDARSDLQQLVQDWTATITVDATDPGMLPLNYMWTSSCPGAVAAMGPMAQVTAPPVGVQTDCAVRVDVMNTMGFGRSCSIPLSMTPGSAISQEQVRIIDSSSNLRVQDATDDAWTFVLTDDTPPVFLPGDYLVVVQPGGGIRQVVSTLYEPPNLFFVETIPAGIPDIVSQADMSGAWTLSSITASDPPSSRSSETENLPGCRPAFNGIEVDGGSGIEIGVTLDRFTFSPSLDVSARVDNLTDLKKIEIVGQGDIDIEATTGASVGAGIDASASFDLTRCTWYFTFAIGPVPVLVKVVLALEAGVYGNANAVAGVTQKLEFSGMAKGGVKYDGSSWSKIKDSSSGFTAHAPQLSITGDAYVEGYLGPRLEVLFYAVAGPIINAQAYIYADATADLGSGTFDWSTGAGFRGAAGGKIDILNIEEEFTFELFDILWPSNPMAQASNEFLDLSYTLDVSNAVTSSGRIYSPHPTDPIDCPGDCTATLPAGSQLELIPVATPGWRFDGFSGYSDCANGHVTFAPDKQCVAHWTAVTSALPNASITLHENATVSAAPHVAWSSDSSTVYRTNGTELTQFDLTGQVVESVTPTGKDVTVLTRSPFGPEFAAADSDRSRVLGVRTSECEDSSDENDNQCFYARESYVRRFQWPFSSTPDSQSAISALEFTKSAGRYYASGTSSGGIRIYTDGARWCDAMTVDWQGTVYGVNDLAWSPDGEELIVAAEGFGYAYRFVKINEPFYSCALNYLSPGASSIFQPLGAYTTPCTINGTANAVAWSPDQRFLATGCENGTIGIKEHSGRVVPDTQLPGQDVSFSAHTDEVNDIDWHPDGTMLASVGDDGFVRIWNWDGTALAAIPYFHGNLKHVKWSPDGRFLAVGGDLNSVAFVIEAVP